MNSIPFNKPFLVGREFDYLHQALESGNASGDGPYTQQCCDILESMTGGTCLLTPSCTAALEIAAMVACLGPGDEVLMPSFTYVSTANAFVRQGAKPVFLDISPDTFNLDPDQLEQALTKRTKALVVMHYGGVPGRIDSYRSFAKKHSLILIEDAAAAIGSWFNNEPAGSFGDLAAFSFHETKNIGCGQGGALVINREGWIELARIIHDRGTDRAAFLRGEVSAYTWQQPGSAFCMSELPAAYLLAQLSELDAINRRRRTLVERYEANLDPLFHQGILSGRQVPEACTNNYHVFPILLPTLEARESLRKALLESGILSVFHYQPLHLSPMGKSHCRSPFPLPVTESIASRILRLPLFNSMTVSEVDFVCEQIFRHFEDSALYRETLFAI